MTDAWCCGEFPIALGRERISCGSRAAYVLATEVRAASHGWRRVDRVWTCPGCIARENPHATGPHTRIVEEWEHEYGAPCSLVVGPFLFAETGAGVGLDALIALWAQDGDVDAAARVRGLGWALGCVYTTTHGPYLKGAVERAADLHQAHALAMLDAERLALEWSPPIDEEAP